MPVGKRKGDVKLEENRALFVILQGQEHDHEGK
jgi:hypothetical protein